MWTRSWIIDTVDQLGDLDAVTERLLRNPSDFAAGRTLFAPKWGKRPRNVQDAGKINLGPSSKEACAWRDRSF